MGVLDELAALSDAEVSEVLSEMSDAELVALAYDWQTHARPKQLPPGHPDHDCPGCGQGRGDDGSWYICLIQAGRGFGKTRTGAEFIKMWEEQGYRRFHIVAETAADARDVLVEGPAGLLSIYPESSRPIYEPSKRRVTWPSGAVATLFNGVEPGQLRGPQCEKAWVDELAKYRYPEDTWDNLEMGLRLGDKPQVVVTTTPRPIPIIHSLNDDRDCHVVQGSTWENQRNLAERFIQRLVDKYKGTRLGMQELEAHILDTIPGQLVSPEMIEDARWRAMGPDGEPAVPDVGRIVVAIDPAVTSGEDSDETGIIVAGLGAKKQDDLDQVYVLADLSGRYSPEEWARKAVDVYDRLQADLIVGEVNNGGDMVESVIRSVEGRRRKGPVKYRSERATRGKHVRFEPVSSLYEQGRVHHVGNFPDLEPQVCGFTSAGYEGKGSPDRADALVWAITSLMGRREAGAPKSRAVPTPSPSSVF